MEPRPSAPQGGRPPTARQSRIRGGKLGRHFRRQSLLLALAALAGCAVTQAPVAPEVRAALAPTGTLRIGVYPGSPTSLVRGPGAQEMRGLTVEVGRELAQRLGVPAEIVVFERVPEVVAGLKSGKADFTITNASPARALDLDFTPTLVSLESSHLVPAGSRIRTLADVDRPGTRVGVSQGGTSHAMLTRELKQATVVPAPSVTAATEMLRKGELDTFASNKGILFEMADRLPGSRVLDGRWGLEHLAVGVPKGREAGAAYLKAFVADPGVQALVQQAAQRVGLRGLATDKP
jgi:polar amino acid transport system substrate-binding protein